MAIIRRKKKRHGTITIKISRENKMENDKMNGWTKKRKVDTFMGILLQVYCFFPWMRINRKWNTIHMYVIKTFQENDYIKMYNHTFLKQHMWKWKHSQVVAFIFLLMLIFLILLQSIELYELYQCIKNGNQSTNYHVFVWITYLAAFYIFMAIASTGFAAFYSMPMFCYMMLFLAVIGIWIFLDIQAEAWDVETGQHRAELEEQDKKMLQMKVKAMEEQYREMLKSRKVVHDMKNHLLALKKYDQERDWEGLHQYLNELSDDMLDDSYQIWTGNRMLDMILNQKTKDAKEKETDMQIETEVFATLPFSDREIISLFGNVLDNALEACERIQDKKRWIKIKIKKKNHLLYIETSNAIKEMPVQNQKEFVSVKEDEILHGYGMKNIQDIVRKYDGIFRYKIYGEYLVCIISIYDIRGAEEE